MNTSSTGGYVSQTNPADTQAQILSKMHDLVVGITGLDKKLVRPRWQNIIPTMPEVGVDWVAFGVDSIKKNEPSITHSPDDTDTLTRHDGVSFVFSFYGNNGLEKAQSFIDGVGIPQNTETMRAQGIGLVECTDITISADLINDQWQRRYDIRMYFNIRIDRTYPIQNILTAPVAVFS